MAKKNDVDLESLTAQMDDVKDTIARLKYELKEAEKKESKLQLVFESLLTNLNVEEMTHGIYSWGFVEKTTNRLNQGKIKEDYPDVYQACYLPSTSKTFKFKING